MTRIGLILILTYFLSACSTAPRNSHGYANHGNSNVVYRSNYDPYYDGYYARGYYGYDPFINRYPYRNPRSYSTRYRNNKHKNRNKVKHHNRVKHPNRVKHNNRVGHNNQVRHNHPNRIKHNRVRQNLVLRNVVKRSNVKRSNAKRTYRPSTQHTRNKGTRKVSQSQRGFNKRLRYPANRASAGNRRQWK